MSGLADHCRYMELITPSTSDLDATKQIKALYFGSAGIVGLQTGSHSTEVPVGAFQILPCRPTRINSSNTTSTSIFGMYD